MMNETLELKIKNLPDSPGCYLMKERGQIIYVGKAVNLKNRVRSYFQNTYHTPKVAAMVARVDDFDIVLARTNLEALLLECNLIKLHRPFYNILLKDDKGYPYIRVNVQDPYPRATLARRTAKDGARYFGPYIGASAVRDVLELLRKTFRLRTCRQELPRKTPGRPCMNYEIGRCMAPCAGLCTQEEYRLQVLRALAFLNGDYQAVRDELTAEMKAASAKLEFERAAQIRDRIVDIDGLRERQQVNSTEALDRDVIALSHDDLDAMAAVLLIRSGKMVGGETYALEGAGADAPEEALAAFLLQYYDGRKPAREVLCESLPEDAEGLQDYLRERRQAACTLISPQRGEKRALILMAKKNADDALYKRNQQAEIRRQRTIGACEELGKVLGMKTVPHRIEGYDISNTQGVLSVASMVVFIDGEPAKKEYRHYRIKTVGHARRRGGRAHVRPRQAHGGDLPPGSGGVHPPGPQEPGSAPDPARARREPPLRHHLPHRPARQGHRPQPAGGHPRHRPRPPPRPPDSLRQPQGHERSNTGRIGRSPRHDKKHRRSGASVAEE